MDWLAFWASVIGSLTWPTAVVAVALIFRRAIVRVLANIDELSFKGATFKIAREISEVQAKAAVVLPEPAAPPKSASPPLDKPATEGPQELWPRDRVVHLALAAPAALVLESWQEVEREARNALNRSGIQSKHANTAGHLMALRSSGVLPDDAYGVIEDLRRIRNDVAHQPKDAIGPKEALQYVSAAERAVQALRTISTGNG